MNAEALMQYTPSENEEYMNERQLEYFRHKLLNWRDDLLRGVERGQVDLREDGAMTESDPVDRGSLEAEKALELRTRERARKLMIRIDEALERIEDGSYGFCEETGEEIGLRRLEARPIARLCIAAQQRKERRKKLERMRGGDYAWEK